MSAPYGHGYDDFDPRYADLPHGYNPSGAAQGYYGYPHGLELDEEPAFHPPSRDQEHFGFPGGGFVSGWEGSHSSAYGSHPYGSSSGPGTRGISGTDITHPDTEDAYFVAYGPRCIFHWHPIGCGERFKDHEDWQEHIESHFPRDSRNLSQPELGDMPRYWNCGLQCGYSITRANSHRDLWDQKLTHIYTHMHRDKAIPEVMAEDANWMDYYLSRKLCSASEANGFAKHPPTHKPHKVPIYEFRKIPKKFRERSMQKDAPGEPVNPTFNPQTTYPSYQEPQPGYSYPQYHNP
ncbi:hypothetical protein TWF694_008870 [Orbilia ellipsospora]|uniref:C2H2-type domain-containing protein n=1 Tax=Orbilia ellipsospora TaxID=2528407 RepID=A0AAV9XD65_9PEZI